ncbi:unnamed protein product [Lactuca saligna]|uniref:Uncharacterized protein n=1 Tax=Lactuca saligna TaxID=75948 RepID=A0AA35ZAF2_LACSI|nr:unnamed protein product [Lactuca saligna]
MARNQSSQTPSRGSCDRIRKATFGRFRPSFSSKPRVSFTQPMALQQPFSGKEIPIEFVPPPEKTFGEAKFDSFIGRMKMKMSAPSDIGDSKTVDGNDSFNDKVSTFIGRARLKLRATSSMGANGKNVSFK